MNVEQSSPSNESTLNSWKEIGAHFGRDGRTAQRWEKEEGLPVYRHLHKGRATVYAFPSELDAWKEARTAPPAEDPTPASPLLHRLLPSFATGMLLLMALVLVGDTTPDLLRAQAQSASGEVVVRQVAEGDWFLTKASHDGRLVSIHRSSGYYVRDLEGGEERLVVPLTRSYVEMGPAVFSPDNSRLAYTVDSSIAGTLPTYEIHWIGLNGQGDHTVVEDRAHYDDFRLADWSPTGNQLLAVGHLPDGGCDLVVVDIAEETSKALHRRQNCIGVADVGGLFTLEGLYVFFNNRDPRGTPREILSIPVGGGEATPVFEHPADDGTVGWTADGRLIFQSDRTATAGIWSVEVRNGRAVGEPTLLSPTIGSVPNSAQVSTVTAIGVGQNGALFYTTRSFENEAYTAKLVPDATRLASGPERVSKRYEGINRSPSYSRDGRWLAYTTGLDTARVIQFRNLETGEERSVPQPINVYEIVWFPDGDELLLYGGQDDQDIFYRMNVATGEGSVLLRENVTSNAATHATFDRSGEWLYFRTGNDASTRRVVRYRLSDGQLETVIEAGETGVRMFAISPDGAEVAVVRREQGIDRIEIVPANGGMPRTIYTYPEDSGIRGFGALEFTADGKAVLHAQRKGDGFYDDALRLTPLDGGPSRELTDTKMLDRIVVHPDGEQIAWGEHYLALTLWVAENLLPTAPTE